MAIRLARIFIVSALLLCLLPGTNAWARDTALKGWLAKKGFRQRKNPGSLDLLGYIFNDKALTVTEKKSFECFPPESGVTRAIQGTREYHADNETLFRFSGRELTLFTRLVHGDGHAGLANALRKAGVSVVEVTVDKVWSKQLSVGELNESVVKKCRDDMAKKKYYVVSDALGVDSMTTHFYNAAGTALQFEGHLSTLMLSLGFTGLGGDLTGANYQHPTVLGYAILPYCSGKRAFADRC